MIASLAPAMKAPRLWINTALTEPVRERLRQVFLPGCARRFFRRNSINTCSGCGTCRRLG